MNGFVKRFKSSSTFVIVALLYLMLPGLAQATPKVIVISLDGATPRFVQQYLSSGVLSSNRGLGLLASRGFSALQNTTVAPSLTAPGHIAIATGSTAADNDVVANSFHLVVSPFTLNISGFGAPIGGYSIAGPAPAPNPTAEPIWKSLQAAGKKVVTATFPGGDGINVTVPAPFPAVGPLIQPSTVRTVAYTVPFGEFGGQGARGFSLTAADFGPAPALTVTQLTAAGKTSFSPVMQKTTSLESFAVGGVTYDFQVAALDTTNNNVVDYDTLVVFTLAQGIQPGPFARPSTGPAYIKVDGKSALFYLEGSTRKVGGAFFVSFLAPNLSTVRLMHYSFNNIPVNPTVQTAIDDVNNNVGFWAPQPDFRIPERLSPGFNTFPDEELESAYEDQVVSFVDYQTRLALRAISQNSDADLVMVYIEQPDGSGHQFLLVDPRQPSNFLDPNSIGAGQDPVKVARYARFLEKAYQVADDGVQRILEAVGFDGNGRPNADVIVVSDHGFDPFHTAVNMNALLFQAGISPTQARAITSGPAVNVYISLMGREPNGTVSAAQYVALQNQIADLLRNYADTNATYTNGILNSPIFDKVYTRPLPLNAGDPPLGQGTSDFIGQDSGDVFAMLKTGYNFDGTQIPVVQRKGDAVAATPVLSLPNFYGAHGYDPEIPNMSAIFLAAGPHIGRGVLPKARNIDIAPTVSNLLGVPSAPTVEGSVLPIGPLTLVTAVSRKSHGSAGVFDLPLAKSGKPTVEGRKVDEDTQTDGVHRFILTFNKPIVSSSVRIVSTQRAHLLPEAIQGNQLVLPLANAADGETVSISVAVTDLYGGSLETIVSMALLRGDVNGDGVVDQTDLNLVRAASAGVGASNYGADVTVNGSINQADVAQVRSRLGNVAH